MFVVLELEIRLNLLNVTYYTGDIEFIEHNVEEYDNYEDCVKRIQQKKEETIKRGYFDKVKQDEPNCVILHNGSKGAYIEYRIVRINNKEE